MKRRALVSCLVVAAAGIVAAQAPSRTAGPPSGVVAVNAQNGALLRSWDATRRRHAPGRRARSLSRTSDRHGACRPHARTLRTIRQRHPGRRRRGHAADLPAASRPRSSASCRRCRASPDRPELSEDAARDRFRALLVARAARDRPLELVILTKDDGSHALAYTTHVWTGDGVDADLPRRRGAAKSLLRYNDLAAQSAVGTGIGVLGDTKKISTRLRSGRYLADDALRPPMLITYDMQGNLTRTERLPRRLLRPTRRGHRERLGQRRGPTRATVDAHVYLGYTYDYYFKRFGRKGLDDRERAHLRDHAPGQAQRLRDALRSTTSPPTC